MRTATITRRTSETQITVTVKVDGAGAHDIATGIGFFDHMLAQLSRHSLIDLDIEATGDTHIDDHHTVEDVGVTLGQAMRQAIGECAGIRRYADVHLVMDEAMTRAAIDVSGRAFLVWNVPFATEKIGAFDTQLVEEFFRAFVMNAGFTLHVLGLSGTNSHHIAETCFKALARVLRAALEIDPRQENRIPSTKGRLGD